MCRTLAAIGAGLIVFGLAICLVTIVRVYRLWSWAISTMGVRKKNDPEEADE